MLKYGSYNLKPALFHCVANYLKIAVVTYRIVQITVSMGIQNLISGRKTGAACINAYQCAQLTLKLHNHQKKKKKGICLQKKVEKLWRL